MSTHRLVAVAAWLSLPAAAVAHDLRVGILIGGERTTVTLQSGTLAGPDVAGSPVELGAETLIVWARPEARGAASTYRIQAAAVRDGAAAGRLRGRLEPLLEPVTLERGADGLLRLLGGAFPTREQADGRIAAVRPSFPDAFVVEEAPDVPAAAMKLALVAGDRVIASSGPLRLRPGEGGLVRVDGVAYRGTIEILVDARGRLTVINQIDLEEYLRGVVAKEMGPLVYPEPEALKAQAVAARTYAAAHLAGPAVGGFDLCATPACQVYGGADAEHPVTDQAVSETRGLVLEDDVGLVRAYFSANCGGHTEDVERVFVDEPARPALRGVACAPPATGAIRLPPGGALSAVVAEDGSPLAAAVAVLVSAGVLERLPDDDWLRVRADTAEIREWVRRAARASRRPPSDAELASRLSLRALWPHLVESLGLEERARVLLAETDVLALTRSSDAAGLSERERRAAAALALLGALPVFADGAIRPDSRPSRGLVLAMLERVLDALGVPALDEAVLVGLEDGELVTRAGSVLSRDPLAPQAYLLKEASQGRRRMAFAGGLALPGDPVRLLRRDGRVILLVVLEATAGGDDRRASTARWTVLLGREELERRLRGHHEIGTLQDLQVVGRGSSGRPERLELVGSSGSARVRGYAIKTLLGLKDDLFVVEPVPGDAGEPPRAFRFLGRGWGHGVGLCQEGAFGMALRGASFRDILSRYYSGARLVDLDEIGRRR